MYEWNLPIWQLLHVLLHCLETSLEPKSEPRSTPTRSHFCKDGCRLDGGRSLRATQPDVEPVLSINGGNEFILDDLKLNMRPGSQQADDGERDALRSTLYLNQAVTKQPCLDTMRILQFS